MLFLKLNFPLTNIYSAKKQIWDQMSDIFKCIVL